MRELKENECYCCGSGCGETGIDKNGKSDCCGSAVFIWDTDDGVIVTDPE